MHQVAAAQVGHLEVDVAQVEAGQVGAAEVQPLRTANRKLGTQKADSGLVETVGRDRT